jgi:hypothetical protein
VAKAESIPLTVVKEVRDMTLKAAFATVFVAALAVAGTSGGVFADDTYQCVSPCTGFTDAGTGARVCSCPPTFHRPHPDPACPQPPCVLYTDPVTGQLICACPQ